MRAQMVCVSGGRAPAHEVSLNLKRNEETSKVMDISDIFGHLGHHSRDHIK